MTASPRRGAKATACAAIFAVILLALAPHAARAQAPTDSSTLDAESGLIGTQVVLTLDVLTPTGATVELDPANPSWAGIEIIRLESVETTPLGSQDLHRLEVVVAAFRPGAVTFQPALNIVEGSSLTLRLLPALEYVVQPGLAHGEPLELTPLAPPAAIGGAESPFLRPAIAIGVGLSVLALGYLAYRAAMKIRVRRPRSGAAPTAPPAADLGLAESLIESDPVSAYRSMAATVRAAIADRYRFPARALTTAELERRMHGAGVDRWEARLVSGLLAECDSVVYAGYRPASERRHSDLNMAREILEAGA